jgi:hypothetical protein
VLIKDIRSAEMSSDVDFTSLLVSYGLNGLVVHTRDIAPPPPPPLLLSSDGVQQDDYDSGYLLDFLIANRNPVGCEVCETTAALFDLKKRKKKMYT